MVETDEKIDCTVHNLQIIYITFSVIILVKKLNEIDEGSSVKYIFESMRASYLIVSGLINLSLIAGRNQEIEDGGRVQDDMSGVLSIRVSRR